MHISRSSLYTEYPKERVCVIDFLPSAQNAYVNTFNTLKRIGLTSDRWLKHHKDITQLFYHYCFESMNINFDKCPSKLRKIFVVYPVNKKDTSSIFINKNIKPILNASPYPFCYVNTIHSPDVSSAANKALDKNVKAFTKFTKFTRNNNLTQLSKQFETKCIFSNIRVDFSK